MLQSYQQPASNTYMGQKILSPVKEQYQQMRDDAVGYENMRLRKNSLEDPKSMYTNTAGLHDANVVPFNKVPEFSLSRREMGRRMMQDRLSEYGIDCMANCEAEG